MENTEDGGGKIDAKIPEELDGGDSLVPKSSEVNEEDDPTCLLSPMVFLCQIQQTKLPQKLKPPPPQPLFNKYRKTPN